MVGNPTGKTHRREGEDRPAEQQHGHPLRHPVLKGMHPLAMNRPFVVQRTHHAVRALQQRIALSFIFTSPTCWP